METNGKNQDDILLVKACLAQDEQAWHTLLTKYRKICSILARQYNLYHQFDDLFSAFIVKLVGTPARKGVLHTYNGKTALNTFLSVIFRHMLFDYHRQTQRRAEDISEKEIIERYSDCDKQIEYIKNPATENLMKLLLNEVAHLPDIEKTVIELHYFQELSVRTIAGIVGFSKSKVNRLILTIKDKLKTSIETNMGQEPYIK